MLIHENFAFDPIHTFECGQCFRWNCNTEGVYIGISKDKVCRVNGREIICDDNDADFWYEYFSLGTDYAQIQKELLLADKNLEKCIDFGRGIRILKQDVWETIVSFIISANNNIPRIKKIIETMCEMFGKRLEFDGTVYYSFPTPDKIASLKREDLSPLKAGYRDAYIIDAAQKVAQGVVDLEALTDMSDKDVKTELMRIKGVGGKVADCIMLFSLGRFSVFPTDVWIKRILTEVYHISEKDIMGFVNERYGSLAGFAQQYLYYYYRSNS